MNKFEIGDLVRIIQSKIVWKLGPIHKYLREKNAIGIVSNIKYAYHRSHHGDRCVIVVVWNDGSTSEINEIYLEKVNESNV